MSEPTPAEFLAWCTRVEGSITIGRVQSTFHPLGFSAACRLLEAAAEHGDLEPIRYGTSAVVAYRLAPSAPSPLRTYTYTLTPREHSALLRKLSGDEPQRGDSELLAAVRRRLKSPRPK